MSPLAVGAQAPDFARPDQFGEIHRLSDLLREGAVVLFFYPAALTLGCTRQSCHFRDLEQELRAGGARPVGISTDPVERQHEFARRHGFGYPLLSDADGGVAEAYGVRRRLFTPVRRTTFVIDGDQVVRHVVRSELRMELHADEALAFVRAM